MREIPFSAPDSVRYPKGQNAEALAFCAAHEALAMWPADIPLDEFSARLIIRGAEDAALTIHLSQLANF